VKKGDEEYLIVVEGVKDTGLTFLNQYQGVSINRIFSTEFYLKVLVFVT